MKRRYSLSLVPLVLSGCAALFGPDLRPTVQNLSETIQEMREKDYETDRMKFSDDPEMQAALKASRIERFKAAENNAAVALGKEPPHKDAQPVEKTGE